MGTRIRSFVLIAFVLLTALSLPPKVRGTATYSDVFPAALSNYSYGGWQGPFGDGTAGRLFPTADGTGIYADATYNGLVWALRSSPEFSSIDMTMHFSIPNRDFTTADYFALLLILHSPTTPPSTPPGTNCDGTCSYVTALTGFKILYRIGFNQLVITNGQGNVTLSQVSLSPVALNQPHDARATYAAGNLTVYLDSVQLVTLQTTNLPAGQIGFETYRTDLTVNTITLIGSPVPGFGLSVNPASATIAPGSSTNTTVIVGSVSGFSGTVALSATTSTSSLTASLNPSNQVLASGSNLTSTLTVGTSCFSGNETVTVTGTSGSDTRSVTFTVRSQGQCPFDFSLSASPMTLTIVPGGFGGVETAIATLIAGVTNPVTFSITTALPTGVTASSFTSFSCSPTCSATVTLSASATAPSSSDVLTIQAVGGGVTHTATFTLVVGGGGPFDFSLAATPADLTIAEGGPGGVETATATLVAGSALPISFSLSIVTPLPSGVTASAFAPSSCSPTCSANVTLTASATAPDSLTTIQMQAVGGGITRTAIFALFVRPPGFNFTLGIVGAPLFLIPGGDPNTVGAAAVLTGSVTTPVTFSLTTPLPNGVTLSSFTPTSCSPSCTADITFLASPTAPISTTTMTVQAIGGGLTRTANFTIVMECGFGGSPSFDFCLSASPKTLTVVEGGNSVVETATARLVTGATAPVTFSISFLPVGVTASAFAPSSCNLTCSANVTLTASATAPILNETLFVQALSGGLTRTASFSLAVVCTVTGTGFNFCLSNSPATLFITGGGAGGVETVTATIISGASQAVTFNIASLLPSGVTASAFTPTSCSPTCTATVTLIASTTACESAGVTTVTIQATGGGVARTATFNLLVDCPPFSFGLAATPATLTIVPGGPGAVETFSAILLSGVAAPVTFTLSTLPVGVVALFTPSPPTCTPSPSSCSVSAALFASVFAPPSTTTITVTGTSGFTTATTTFSLVVQGCLCDFSLAATPVTLTIASGGAGGVEAVIATFVAGTNPTVTFSFATALPAGVTASAFSPPSCIPTCTATVTLTASPTAPSSTTVVAISATGGGLTRTTTFFLTVVFSAQDIDGDGIFNGVDTQPTVFSNDFSDVPLGGTTYGTILSRGDRCLTLPCQLTIQEVSPSTGILITASPTGGLTPASISVCGGAAILSVNAGDALTVECGSVTIIVTSGAVQVTFVGSGSNAGINGIATITAGNSITFEPATFSFTAPATNTATIIVTINGNALPIAPGQTTSTPFAIFTVSVINPTGQVFSAGVVTKFDGSASFAAVGPITSYTWNFGDGTVLTNAASKVTHTYAVNGTYTVTLAVADKLGNSNSQSQTINVMPAPIVGSETFSRNLFVSGNRLIQNVTVQITNPNSYPIFVNVRIAGNCDTVCPFSDQSGPILLTAGQTKYISVIHNFSPLDQGQTFVMQVTVTFTTDTSNMAVGTYLLASSRTFSFRIS